MVPMVVPPVSTAMLVAVAETVIVELPVTGKAFGLALGCTVWPYCKVFEPAGTLIAVQQGCAVTTTIEYERDGTAYVAPVEVCEVSRKPDAWRVVTGAEVVDGAPP
jgi:hypothetical protein